MNAPKFDIDQKVYLKCKVLAIETRNGKWEYVLEIPSIIDNRVRWVGERDLVSKMEDSHEG